MAFAANTELVIVAAFYLSKGPKPGLFKNPKSVSKWRNYYQLSSAAIGLA